jgi:predicted acyltransferase
VLVDLWRKKKLAFPFIVIGVNSITAYCAAHLFQAWAFNSFKRLFGREVFTIFGGTYEPVVYGFVVLLFLWSVLFAMYRAEWFVRI